MQGGGGRTLTFVVASASCVSTRRKWGSAATQVLFCSADSRIPEVLRCSHQVESVLQKLRDMKPADPAQEDAQPPNNEPGAGDS